MTSHSIMTVVAAAGLAVLLASPANAAEQEGAPIRLAQYRLVEHDEQEWEAVQHRDLQHLRARTDPDPRIRHGIMQDIGSKFGGGPD